MATAIAIEQAGGQAIAIALLGTGTGNLIYFGLMLRQDVWHTRQALHACHQAHIRRSFGRNVRALVVEFGAAEALDNLFIRSALMYWLPRWLHSVPQGIVVASFAADIIFYIPAIISYELSK